jgi:hypothetical protein
MKTRSHYRKPEAAYSLSFARIVLTVRVKDDVTSTLITLSYESASRKLRRVSYLRTKSSKGCPAA